MPENEDGFMFDSIELGEDFLVKEGDNLNLEDIKSKEEKDESENLEKEQLIDTDELNSNNLESGDDSQTGKTVTSSSSLSLIVTALGEELGIEVNEEDLKKAENQGQFLRDLLQKHVSELAAKDLSVEEKEALEAIRSGVMPKELAKTKVNQNAYASLDEEKIKENVSLQEVLVKNSLITRGFTEEKANEMIADFKVLGEEKLLKEAMEAKTFMVEKEKEHEAKLKEEAKLTAKQREEARTQSLEKVKNFVMSQKEVIPNMELTESFKTDIYKSMTTAVAKDPEGNPLNEVQVTRSKNPVDFEFKLNLYHKLGLFNEKPDFSKLMKVAETKTSKGLEKLLKEGNDFISNGKSKKEASSDDLGLGIFE